jgi:hypothetical protein
LPSIGHLGFALQFARTDSLGDAIPRGDNAVLGKLSPASRTEAYRAAAPARRGRGGGGVEDEHSGRHNQNRWRGETMNDIDSASMAARISILEQRNEKMETALRVIAFGTAARLREWLAKYDSKFHYPNADTYDLSIHVARRALV